MKLLLILATAITLAAAGSRSYRSESHHSKHRDSGKDRERRGNLDYDDIETADQELVERFEDQSNRKSNRIGPYSAVHTLQVSKGKQGSRRRPKASGSVKDSEASGTHFEGTHYGTHYANPQVQQIHTHELLTSQGLVPIYPTHHHHHHGAGAPPNGNIHVLTSGIGVAGLADGHHGHHGHHHHHHAPLIVAGGAPHAPGPLIASNHPGAAGHPENDLGTDITKSVYVFSAPPDPFDYVPRQTISKVPRPQKHYQVLFINAPTPPPPQQHHIELPRHELKTLVYVLLKKPQAPPPINFIRGPPSTPNKPEVYFIRYKNGGLGLGPSPVGPLEDTIPVGHPGLQVQYAPISPQEEIRGNIDYGPAHLPLSTPEHHPYELNDYQDDSHLAATQVIGQRGGPREVDAGVGGI